MLSKLEKGLKIDDLHLFPGDRVIKSSFNLKKKLFGHSSVGPYAKTWNFQNSSVIINIINGRRRDEALMKALAASTVYEQAAQ